MPAHSRSKNGVASLAYVAGIHVLNAESKAWMAGTSPAMTVHGNQNVVQSPDPSNAAAARKIVASS